ncbi:hypothetical protein BDV27DRAFT_160590 [Aspergillus caelatus]|uniref:Uncharacterized protein n=1 Tax=Aspergillus caelatus TaxID=61420 RepID=A0A5N6ZVA5_9EURO|nr:uncharacterized protein BDV27DRAFT_160590 [Aspergillus caelatus]KAE8361541.1 hypothetical protein BDV27DRAFT_160590 [Aspergillus caelatus]
MDATQTAAAAATEGRADPVSWPGSGYPTWSSIRSNITRPDTFHDQQSLTLGQHLPALSLPLKRHIYETDVFAGTMAPKAEKNGGSSQRVCYRFCADSCRSSPPVNGMASSTDAAIRHARNPDPKPYQPVGRTMVCDGALWYNILVSVWEIICISDEANYKPYYNSRCERL